MVIHDEAGEDGEAEQHGGDRQPHRGTDLADHDDDGDDEADAEEHNRRRAQGLPEADRIGGR